MSSQRNDNYPDLLEWLAGFPFVPSDPHMFREFSDGTKVGMIIEYYFPRSVNQRFLVPSTNSNQKRANWDVLNSRR